MPRDYTGTLVTPQSAAVYDTAAASSMWAVVFAGGIGSRFWPLSTPARPKPLLALVSGSPLLADTVGRLQPLIPPERVLIATSRDIAPAIRSVVQEVPEANVLIEPRPLGTAAALAWAAQEVARRAGPETLLCAVHADLAIGFPGAFREGIRRAASIAQSDDALVALGVRATRAEPQFGYHVLGALLDADAPFAAAGARPVASFVEKPSEQEARALVGDDALWHSGVVMGSAKRFLSELRDCTPEIAPGLPALAAGDLPLFVQAIRSVGLERGLLERTERMLVLPCDCGWDDVGTWASLRRARELDDDGNGALGEVSFVDATGNVVHAERGSVVMYGVSQLLVVSLNGLTFVTTLERANDLKPMLDALPGSMRINPSGQSVH